ncbi:dTDP-4-dehydrorhamnose reductase [Brevibacillus sp. AG162]|uniref:sugar nucleotide-binding protein n=1 Tax=Brevibacillus sp. AG162 TaxID=2572910 RepID=UPI00114D7FDE|nr:sugar nucleotide-binding protein [Brevibacillus sp. AG162]TQK62607.1 dTDP-4-dehydrorhamnose reductase [Brevibacillus sp. AG162]
MEKRRVLLLGASGYLGSQIYQELLRDNAIDLMGTCFSAQAVHQFLRVDVTDTPSFSLILQEFSPHVVIWALMSATDERELIEKGLEVLLSHLPEESKLIFISTDGIFGRGTGSYREEDPPEPLDERNLLAAYTNAKIRGEARIRKRHPNHVIVRVGPLYGRNAVGQWDKRVASMCADLEAGREVSRSGNLYKTFVHVEDVGSAIHELLHGSYLGTLHLGPAEKESYYSFYKKIALALGLTAEGVKETLLTEAEAQERGIPLDTSLRTKKARELLQTRFRQAGWRNAHGNDNDKGE